MKKRTVIHIFVLVVSIVPMIFATSCKKHSIPTLNTYPVIYISEQSVSCEGNITDDGGAEVTERGICWNTSGNPTTANNKIACGSGTGDYTGTINGLTTNCQHYMRAYAINKAGTGYGPEIKFRTWNTDKVTDIDGNVYHTVTIGSQIWTVENLKVTHYRNGDAIPNITSSAQWEGLTTGAYCDYNNNSDNSITYGRLYNWFSVDDSRNIAPDGWHVPTDAEWTLLANYLDGEAVAGGKMKEAGLAHWNEPNSGATNETGFTGLPGGHCDYAGIFSYIKLGAGWWTSTSENPNDAWIRYLDYGAADIWKYLEDKRYGRSVRCVKD